MMNIEDDEDEIIEEEIIEEEYDEISIVSDDRLSTIVEETESDLDSISTTSSERSLTIDFGKEEKYDSRSSMSGSRRSSFRSSFRGSFQGSFQGSFRASRRRSLEVLLSPDDDGGRSERKAMINSLLKDQKMLDSLITVISNHSRSAGSGGGEDDDSDYTFETYYSDEEEIEEFEIEEFASDDVSASNAHSDSNLKVEVYADFNTSTSSTDPTTGAQSLAEQVSKSESTTEVEHPPDVVEAKVAPQQESQPSSSLLSPLSDAISPERVRRKSDFAKLRTCLEEALRELLTTDSFDLNNNSCSVNSGLKARLDGLERRNNFKSSRQSLMGAFLDRDITETSAAQDMQSRLNGLEKRLSDTISKQMVAEALEHIDITDADEVGQKAARLDENESNFNYNLSCFKEIEQRFKTTDPDKSLSSRSCHKRGSHRSSLTMMDGGSNHKSNYELTDLDASLSSRSRHKRAVRRSSLTMLDGGSNHKSNYILAHRQLQELLLGQGLDRVNSPRGKITTLDQQNDKKQEPRQQDKTQEQQQRPNKQEQQKQQQSNKQEQQQQQEQKCEQQQQSNTQEQQQQQKQQQQSNTQEQQQQCEHQQQSITLERDQQPQQKCEEQQQSNTQEQEQQQKQQLSHTQEREQKCEHQQQSITQERDQQPQQKCEQQQKLNTQEQQQQEHQKCEQQQQRNKQERRQQQKKKCGSKQEQQQKQVNRQRRLPPLPLPPPPLPRDCKLDQECKFSGTHDTTRENYSKFRETFFSSSWSDPLPKQQRPFPPRRAQTIDGRCSASGAFYHPALSRKSRRAESALAKLQEAFTTFQAMAAVDKYNKQRSAKKKYSDQLNMDNEAPMQVFLSRKGSDSSSTTFDLDDDCSSPIISDGSSELFNTESDDRSGSNTPCRRTDEGGTKRGGYIESMPEHSPLMQSSRKVRIARERLQAELQNASFTTQ